MLPSFVVIGAMKSGTTALARLLDQHPQVAVAAQKEVRFFSHDDNWRRGVEWYEDQFRGCEAAVAVGDVSPAYAFHPVFPDSAARMASVLPDVRLIYIVRNPIERIRSQYMHDTRAGRVIDEGIDEAVRTHSRYLDCSRYGMQIDRYLAHYDADQLLVVTSEALGNDPSSVLSRIHSHIGVDAGSLPDDPAARHNESAAVAHRVRPGLRRVRRLPVVKRVVRAVPTPMRGLISKVTSLGVSPAEVVIGEETRNWLSDRLRPEIESLSTFMAPDFDGWGIAPP